MCIPVTLLAAAVVFAPGAARSQQFMSGGALASMNGEPAAGASATGSSFADGTRAINQGRWSDAIAIFSKLADQKGDHADGALYWTAYAENKLGNSGQALDTCTSLLHQYPASSWIEDCGALKIEIRAKDGKPVPPSAEQSDELKLLALASLMRHDEKHALAEINDILNGDSSERLKQGALFIMGEHHTDTIDPQIARVSYVEGDVRISRGDDSSHGKKSDWEQAVANLPLQTGYSLVTGKGRAVIEFEDDSTLYLGEDSVLLFNDLHTTAGVPRTEVALLSGMVTLHIQPSVPGEWFVLRTPTDALATKYPNATNLRINSYTDGIGLTPLMPSDLMTTGNEMETISPGTTLYYKEARPIIEAGPIHPPDYSTWDNWVATRYAQREKETAAALKASGLKSPIPGLADLAKEGTFFPCEPYGTCWKPNPQQSAAAGNSLVAANSSQNGPASQAELLPSDVQPAAPGSKIGFLGTPMPNSVPQSYSDFADMDMMFPCMPNGIRYLMMGSMYPAGPQMLNSALLYYGQPWAWAVCNAGGWINQNNQYVWVAGRPIHHLPVRWIKSGHTVGFVPIHPYDIAGRPPVNSRNGVFTVDPKGPHPIERMALQAGRKIDILNEPPRAFRTDFAPPLARAEAPHMVAHEIKDFSVARSGLAKASGIPITFDHRSQTFMMSHEVMQGGRSVSVTAPIGGREGGLQSRGYYGGGAASGGGAGWRGGSNAGSNAGGGARSGSQGASSGNGGYHGGGGSVSSGSSSAGSSGGASSSAGSSGGSGASSSGGGHH
jgi:hypothetical protein